MITVVTPISPIPSHPDTAILDYTIESVRHHLPDAEIILTFDGVRHKQEDRRADYEEFIRRTLWKADHAWGNVAPWIYDEHTHQAGMLRGVIDDIRTPLMFYVEQDTPLCVDRDLDLAQISDFVMSGSSNLTRLHHEARIPDEHQHMMHGFADDAHFLRTSQWSQRPHVAAVGYYKRILADHFTENAHCFIEDVMHGVADEAWLCGGVDGWNAHRLHIYHPDGDIKRAWHTDGRAGAEKYETSQTF